MSKTNFWLTLDVQVFKLRKTAGKPQAIEFEYKRHGTQTLIAGLNVTTGKIIGECGATRTEEDLKNFIERVVTENKGYKKYHFVGDQLNTHKSESCLLYTSDAADE